jgi:hypothetical protein
MHAMPGIADKLCLSGPQVNLYLGAVAEPRLSMLCKTGRAPAVPQAQERSLAGFSYHLWNQFRVWHAHAISGRIRPTTPASGALPVGHCACAPIRRAARVSVLSRQRIGSDFDNPREKVWIGHV